MVRNVSRAFAGVSALSNVDLDVYSGRVVVLVGASGSGKSTLCRCINRLETIDSGEIIFDGRPLPEAGRELAAFRANVGMVFQSFNLFGHKTILENVVLAPIMIRHSARATATERAKELLDRVGIVNKVNAYPNELSGGQQQRAAIARALAMDPKVLLFDEPTSALDPEMINEVLDVMVALAADGMTMVVVTHEMGFARSVGDTVVFLDRGRVIEQAPPEQFFDNPQSERARSFLAKIRPHQGLSEDR